MPRRFTRHWFRIPSNTKWKILRKRISSKKSSNHSSQPSWEQAKTKMLMLLRVVTPRNKTRNLMKMRRKTRPIMRPSLTKSAKWRRWLLIISSLSRTRSRLRDWIKSPRQLYKHKTKSKALHRPRTFKQASKCRVYKAQFPKKTSQFKMWNPTKAKASKCQKSREEATKLKLSLER